MALGWVVPSYLFQLNVIQLLKWTKITPIFFFFFLVQPSKRENLSIKLLEKYCHQKSKLISTKCRFRSGDHSSLRLKVIKKRIATMHKNRSISMYIKKYTQVPLNKNIFVLIISVEQYKMWYILKNHILFHCGSTHLRTVITKKRLKSLFSHLYEKEK